MDNINQDIECVLYIPKSKLWVAKKGGVSVKKYAKVFADKTEVEAVKKHYHKKNVEVEIQELNNGNEIK